MAKILEVKTIKTKLGAVRVLVTTPEKDVWVPFGQWMNKCKAPLDSYVGGEFQADYYQESEEMLNHEICTKSDVVLKDFMASVNPEVTALAHEIASNRQLKEAMDMNALFNRRRAEAKAKEAVKQEA